jgi:hypothetical protein
VQNAPFRASPPCRKNKTNRKTTQQGVAQAWCAFDFDLVVLKTKLGASPVRDSQFHSFNFLETNGGSPLRSSVKVKAVKAKVPLIGRNCHVLF